MDCFAETADGLLLIANGIQKVLRWDGMLPGVEDAGVPAPATALIIGSSGSGAISGTYNAYVRFVDRLGRVSDLSPISNEITITSKLAITYSSVPTPPNQAITRRQILRNTTGQQLTYYVDVDTTDLGSTTFQSTLSDTLLQANEAVPLFDNNGKDIANVHGLPPNHKAFICQHQQRMFAAGEVEIAEGACIVTFGSPTVEGIGTDWKEELAGRLFYPDDTTESYEIEEIDEATQVMTLTSNYRGADDPYLYYAIRSAPAERNLIYFTEAGLPESWPALNAFAVPEDGFDITGLMAMGSFLYILKRRRIYRLTAQDDPAEDGFVFQAAKRGCVNNRCWINLGDEAYLLDDQGAYLYSGGDVEEIDGQIQEIFRATNRNYKLNWNTSKFWHASHDPTSKTIRWFVSMGGDYLPRNALCFNYALKRWWVEEYPSRLGSSYTGRQTTTRGSWRDQARDQVYLGGVSKKIWAFGNQLLDGPDERQGSIRGTVSSATLLSFTDLTATPAASGLVGSRVYIVRGTGLGQSRLITAVSGTTFSIDQPWTIKPDTTSHYVIGGIPWLYRTGKFNFNQMEVRDVRNAIIDMEPCAPATNTEAYAQIFHDYQATGRPSTLSQDHSENQGVGATLDSADRQLDMTVPEGILQIRMDAHLERYTDGPGKVALEIRGVSGASPVTINRIAFDGVKARNQPQPPVNE